MLFRDFTDVEILKVGEWLAGSTVGEANTGAAIPGESGC